MKIFRMIGAALVAAVIAFAFSSCEKDGKDVYKDYSQLMASSITHLRARQRLRITHLMVIILCSISMKEAILIR